MDRDYTINDAAKDGFECGMLYMLRYLVESEQDGVCVLFNELAEHLAKYKPWKGKDEWYEFIVRNVDRWKR